MKMFCFGRELYTFKVCDHTIKNDVMISIVQIFKWHSLLARSLSADRQRSNAPRAVTSGRPASVHTYSPGIYTWIALQVYTHTKPTPKQSRRATTNPRPHTKRSRQGESRSALTIFVWPMFTYFQTNFPNNVQIKTVKAESYSPCWILLCQGPRCFWGAWLVQKLFF